jgi:septal ring factor EnvC (AmiA/AmiB activator)
MGMGEQSLTPGEQRILALMEQGQQRLEQRLGHMDQRLQSLEEGQKHTNQRLQSLEEGQKHTNQRLQSLETGQKGMDQRLDSMDRRLAELKFDVAEEATRSKLRDRDLASQLQNSQAEHRERNIWLVGEIKSAQQATLQAMYVEMNSFRTLLTERLDQHDTRLQAVERTLKRYDERQAEAP